MILSRFGDKTFVKIISLPEQDRFEYLPGRDVPSFSVPTAGFTTGRVRNSHSAAVLLPNQGQLKDL